jgi:hypothetical protein
MRRTSSYSTLKFRKARCSVILFNEGKAAMITGHWMCATFSSVVVLQTLLLRSDAYLRAALTMCSDVHCVLVCV